jgi:ADP-ribose pyrophosphatase YjhB (NUDIX family)
MTEVKFSAGVFTLIFNPNLTKILLIKRNKQKREKCCYDWGNIGGILELREYSLDGVLREAREEIGVELDKEKTKLLEVLEHPNWSESFHGFHFVYGTILDESTEIKINHESEEFKWFDIDELPEKTGDKPEDIKKWLEIFREKINDS